MQRTQAIAMVSLVTLATLVAHRDLTGQADSGPPQCAQVAQARPDSMTTVDSEAVPARLPFIDEGPRDADQRAIVAHFVVDAAGRVDTTTLRVEHTNDQGWIEQLRRGLATATFTPARSGGCPIARWSTFAVWAQH